MSTLHCRWPVAPLAAAIALASAAALPATPKTQVWIDVSTHNFVGMPEMGAFGDMTSRMMGGAKDEMRYPTARGAGMSGQYLDVALYNSLKPGVEAQHTIPGGLKLGKALPLVPPVAEPTTHVPSTAQQPKMPDVEFTIHEYWGCGATVRPGQPKTFKVKIQGGAAQSSGSMSQGKFVPDRDIDATPAYAVWPNRKDGKRVPNGATLAGSHRISGNGVPESLHFELGRNAEFMPKIALSAKGQATDAIKVDWQAVDRAKAYFLNALAMQGQNTMVFWSSAETAGAGHELQQYLSGSYIDRWLKEKVLLAPSVTTCTIPKGIFAGGGGSAEQSGMGGGMSNLAMIAYGPETHVVWPPKPADPEELKKWDAEWNVRVRTKSTANAMLGMDMGGMNAGADVPSSPEDVADATDDGEPQQAEGQKESKGKKLFKDILRKF